MFSDSQSSCLGFPVPSLTICSLKQLLYHHAGITISTTQEERECELVFGIRDGNGECLLLFSNENSAERSEPTIKTLFSLCHAHKSTGPWAESPTPTLAQSLEPPRTPEGSGGGRRCSVTLKTPFPPLKWIKWEGEGQPAGQDKMLSPIAVTSCVCGDIDGDRLASQLC